MFDSFAEALEAGNQSGRVEQIAGTSQLEGSKLVIDEIPPGTVLKTRKPTEQELTVYRAEKEKSLFEKYQAAITRVIKALDEHPDLRAKRVQNLLDEITSGKIPTSEDKAIEIEESIRPIIANTIRDLFLNKQP